MTYIRDTHADDKRSVEELMSGPMRSASFLIRMTPEEKAELERKVRLAAAMSNKKFTLSDAMRMGASLYMDEWIEKLKDEGEGMDAIREVAQGD